ncbi:FAD/NAD(P)-binding domain-containing protein [Pholiota conissans]|uniref:FAD/NAD(P)-binding domain-containing protein n=1 Tax=Pholiota conissans TaxID=109636 RepID=A0A9P5Z0T4_9AGAR|nr:FAD/NAD(P)-binding domain-containing protein [Pholiota conissans]
MRFALILLSATHVLASFADQTPLSSNKNDEYYQFKRPIRKVAIIGAGVGGLIAHRELREAGFEVHSFERDTVPGGNWHYTDEAPDDAPVPNRDITTGDYIPSLPPKGAKLPYVEVYYNTKENADRARVHRAPKPIWNSLTSNAPAPIQQIRELPWPVGTAWALPNRKLQGYIRAFASFHNLNSNDNNPNISYNTRVELVEKNYDAMGEEDGWNLTVKSLVRLDGNSLKAIWRKEHFDGVIVATGRYNAPNIPNIAGLKEWAEIFPNRIQHSRQYRRPEQFLDEKVLIVGAATSGSEIARDIIKHAKKVYQSVRPETSPIPQRPKADFLKRLPHNVTLFGEIKQFLPPTAAFNQGRIELTNGTIITGIGRIIFATGFRYTYPFLPQFHNSKLGVNDTAPANGVQPIVTDGTHLRSLYLDAFYIPDPTLTFINANFGMQSFTYSEFLSLAIAKIWSGKADFPNTAELWRRYYDLYRERKGYGRHFQFLGAIKTRESLRFFQGWLDDAAVKYGGKQIDGLSKDIDQINAIWTQARYSSGEQSVINALPSASLTELGIDINGPALNGSAPVTGTEAWAQDAVYDDYW